MQKKNKNIIIISTLHKAAEVSAGEDRNPAVIPDYNANKGMDNLGKITGSCKRRSTHWPIAIFQNVIDKSTYGAFVIWSELNPTWRASKVLFGGAWKGPCNSLHAKTTPPSPHSSFSSTGKGSPAIWAEPWSTSHTRSWHKGPEERKMELLHEPAANVGHTCATPTHSRFPTTVLKAQISLQ